MLFNIENTEKYKKISLLGLKINIKKKPIINNICVINERLNEIEDNMKVINEILNLENKIVFTKIYKTNYWGSKESFSGQGSELKSTETLRNKLIDIVKNYNIKSILDIPCGDFNWMKEIVNNFESYTGCDIVSEIVEANNNKYSNENIKFKVLNICSDKLYKVDLIFTRDCLQHLPLDYVIKAINNIKNSGSKYLIASSMPYIEDNLTNDINLGDCRYLNLEKPPFNFPKPILMIKEDYQYTAPDKYMGMWQIKDL